MCQQPARIINWYLFVQLYISTHGSWLVTRTMVVDICGSNTTRWWHICNASVDIEAECQDDYMKIRVGFNGSFAGLLYSAGKYMCLEYVIL